MEQPGVGGARDLDEPARLGRYGERRKWKSVRDDCACGEDSVHKGHGTLWSARIALFAMTVPYWLSHRSACQQAIMAEWATSRHRELALQLEDRRT
jgi:hypothetical protein